jgi:hypothetical protein
MRHGIRKLRGMDVVFAVVCENDKVVRTTEYRLWKPK